jgi:hypothetical protein
MIFIITILLLAIDFYYLKNIAGRRLVGLRWWNEVDTSTGDSRWVFESADPETRTINATDKRFFWIALYAQPVMWVLLAIVALASLKFIWLTLVGECISGGGVTKHYGRDEANAVCWQSSRLFSQSRIPLRSLAVISLAWRLVLCMGLVWRGISQEEWSAAGSGGEKRGKEVNEMQTRRRREDMVYLDAAFGVDALRV